MVVCISLSHIEVFFFFFLGYTCLLCKYIVKPPRCKNEWKTLFFFKTQILTPVPSPHASRFSSYLIKSCEHSVFPFCPCSWQPFPCLLTQCSPCRWLCGWSRGMKRYAAQSQKALCNSFHLNSGWLQTLRLQIYRNPCVLEHDAVYIVMHCMSCKCSGGGNVSMWDVKSNAVWEQIKVKCQGGKKMTSLRKCWAGFKGYWMKALHSHSAPSLAVFYLLSWDVQCRLCSYPYMDS